MSRVPQQARARATRERIARAALTSWSAQGFDAVSVAAVCDAAGVAKGSFYFHFPSKEALLVGLVFGGVSLRAGEEPPGLGSGPGAGPPRAGALARSLVRQVAPLGPALVQRGAREALATGAHPLRTALADAAGLRSLDGATALEAVVLSTLASWGDPDVGDDPEPALTRRMALVLGDAAG